MSVDTLTDIHVEDIEATDLTSRDADIRPRPATPPLSDHIGVRAGVERTVERAWMLAGRPAARARARATTAGGDMVQRYYRPPPLCVLDRCVERIHAEPSIRV